MPRRQVADLFVARYGGRIHSDEIDETLAFKLSLGSSHTLSRGTLRSMTRRERARVIATDTHAGLPMTDIFAVSLAAMAIRLEALDFVF